MSRGSVFLPTTGPRDYVTEMSAAVMRSHHVCPPPTFHLPLVPRTHTRQVSSLNSGPHQRSPLASVSIAPGHALKVWELLLHYRDSLLSLLPKCMSVKLKYSQHKASRGASCPASCRDSWGRVHIEVTTATSARLTSCCNKTDAATAIT